MHAALLAGALPLTARAARVPATGDDAELLALQQAPSGRLSAVHLLHQLRPSLDDRHNLVGFLRREHRHDARNTEVFEALQTVDVLS